MGARCGLVVTAAALLSGCSRPEEPPPFKPLANNQVLMRSVIEPAADVIWNSVGTILTTQGTEDLRPRTDEEWARVRDNAILLTESGNLLMMVPRALDNDEWMTASQALINTGTAAVTAAEAKNADDLFTAGGHIYSSCTNCHQKYAMNVGGGSSP